MFTSKQNINITFDNLTTTSLINITTGPQMTTINLDSITTGPIESTTLTKSTKINK
jgi:hypothetical protein